MSCAAAKEEIVHQMMMCLKTESLLMDEVDCTELVTEYIFHGNNPPLFYSRTENKSLGCAEPIHILTTTYRRRITENRNGGRKYFSYAGVYSRQDEDEEDDDMRLYMHNFCHHISTLCLSMGYSRDMISSITLSMNTLTTSINWMEIYLFCHVIINT